MRTPTAARLRLLLSTVAVAALATGGVTAVIAPASADTSPSSGTPATVSSDPLPTAQVNGVVWSQVVIGDTVFAGGKFTQALPPAGTGGSAVAVTNLMAYKLSTGALIGTFKPSLNGQVLGLATDGTSLFAAGSFTTANGKAAGHLVKLSPSTGATVAGFSVSANADVLGLAVGTGGLYLGGKFTTVNGASRTRAALVDPATGALKTWAPTVADNYVRRLVVNDAQGKIALAGSFTSIDGSAGAAFAILDTATGRTVYPTPIRQLIDNGSTSSAMYDVSSDGTSVFSVGYYSQQDPSRTGNLEGGFSVDWATGATNWLEDCHGDSYAIQPLGDVVYQAGHHHYCYDVDNGYPQTPGSAYQRTLAFTKTATSTLKANTILQPRYYDFAGQPSPTLLNWYPDLVPGSYTGQSQAAWTITTSGKYVLLGGEFPTVNGRTQYGLVRFATSDVAPNTDGPELSGAKYPINVSSPAAGSVRIAWLTNEDRDDATETYRVYRGSTLISTTTAASNIWYHRSLLSFTDTGLAPGSNQSYRVTATDPFGNTAASSTVAVTVASSSEGAYARQVLADGATSYWPLDERSGTTVKDAAGVYTARARGGVTLGAPGAIAGDNGTAATFDGKTTTGIASNDIQALTDTFTVSGWFRTTSATPGQIIGVGDAQTTTTSTITPPGGTPITVTRDSGNHDREIDMNADGSLSFVVFPGVKKTVTSPAAGYDDGRWHFAVGTLSSAGMKLYVDGGQVAADASTTRAQGVASYWRIGGDSGWSTPAPGQVGPPPSTPDYFTGSIDEPAVYANALSAAQVANQYALATAGGTPTPVNSAPTASFTASTNDRTVAFDASASTDSDGTVAGYAWDFGDGTTGTGVTAGHTYTADGTYPVKLTVTDDQGATATTSRSVTVSATTVPPASDALAADAFERTVSGGLGTADVGGAWTVSGGAANFAVGSGRATLSTPKGATLAAVVGGATASGTDVVASFTAPRVPAGSSAYAGVIGRRIGNAYYAARIVVATNGAVALHLLQGSTALGTVATGITVAAGDTIDLRLRTTGASPTTLQARAWRHGSAEPTAWSITRSDSTAALQGAGSTGLLAYLGSSATSTPYAWSVDDFTATTTN
jgi:PKD repeat protein